MALGPGQPRVSSEQALINNSKELAGVDVTTALRGLLLHRHDGSTLGGPQLFGPFFFHDTANGHTYRLDCTNGALVLTQIV